MDPVTYEDCYQRYIGEAPTEIFENGRCYVPSIEPGAAKEFEDLYKVATKEAQKMVSQKEMAQAAKAMKEDFEKEAGEVSFWKYTSF